MRLLLSPSPTKPLILFAKTCLENFVYDFGEIYGKHHVVYNIHSLIHIADDCLNFRSSLNNISAFPFESCLGQLKKLVLGSYKPLAQFTNKLTAIENVGSERVQVPVEEMNIIYFLKQNDNDSFFMLRKKI